MEIIQTIDNLEKSIDEYLLILMSTNESRIVGDMHILSAALTEALPAVMEVYSDERMSDQKDDVTYWPEQLKRILDALGRGDYFLAADALKFELLGNLELLKQKVKEAGIA